KDGAAATIPSSSFIRQVPRVDTRRTRTTGTQLGASEGLRMVSVSGVAGRQLDSNFGEQRAFTRQYPGIYKPSEMCGRERGAGGCGKFQLEQRMCRGSG